MMEAEFIDGSGGVGDRWLDLASVLPKHTHACLVRKKLKENKTKEKEASCIFLEG